MRYCTSLLLVLTIFVGCSKKNIEPRTNFVEITLGDRKFTFDNLEAICDTSDQGFTFNFRIHNRTSNSNIDFELVWGSTSKWINGAYKYPGDLFPGRSVVFFHVQTYVDRVPGTYTAQNDKLTVILDQPENGRIGGTFSGKLFCYTCNPYGSEVDIKGEMEMPFTYQ